MSKIWFSVSIICIFVIGVITFVIIDVFSAQPQKLSSRFITFTIEISENDCFSGTSVNEIFSGTDVNQNYYTYTLQIETSYSENFSGANLTASENVRFEPITILGKTATYAFYVINETEIKFTFSTNNYETKTKTYETIYMTGGQEQIFAKSIENLPENIELKVDETYTIEYNILPNNSTVCNVVFALCENDFEVIENDFFSISNNTITALAVGNGSVFVYLNDDLIKTIPVIIIAKTETEQQSQYSFDISLKNKFDWIEYNSITKEATFNIAQFPYEKDFPTISFNIYIKNFLNNEETNFVWEYSVFDEDNIVLGPITKPTGLNSLAITFSDVGTVELIIESTELEPELSTTITINVVE